MYVEVNLIKPYVWVDINLSIRIMSLPIWGRHIVFILSVLLSDTKVWMCNIIFEGVMALFNDEYVIKRCVLILYPGGGGFKFYPWLFVYPAHGFCSISLISLQQIILNLYTTSGHKWKANANFVPYHFFVLGLCPLLCRKNTCLI